MKRKKEGSIEYFEVGSGNYTLLSVGKLHGDEHCSKEGILSTIKEIESTDNFIKYVGIPEVNPLNTHEYNGVNLNRDFGIFKSEKTRSLDKIIQKYKPNFIIDHHDNLYSEKDEIAIILPYEAWGDDRIEIKTARKLVDKICRKEKLASPHIPSFPDQYLRCKEQFERKIARYVEPGIYRFVNDWGNALIPFYKKGIAIEVPMSVGKKIAVEIHKKCDLIIKEELEKLLQNGK
jgi:hypothetical protein